MKSKRNMLLVAGLIACMATEAGAAGFYSSKTTSAVYLSSSGGVTSYVTSIYAPPGSWVVQALSPAVNFGATDILRCGLMVDGTWQTISSAMMGGGGGMPAALPVQNLGIVNLAYYNTIYLYCWHDAAIGGQRIDPGAQLILTRAPAS